jgi:hypothetical protein
MLRKFIAIVCVLGGSSVAMANEAQRTPLPGCANEVATYCQGVEKGRGRIAKCLRDNKDRLGEACRADIEGLKALIQEIRAERRKKWCANQSGEQ